MFEFEMSSSIVLDASVERAWQAVADANKWPDWAAVCTKVWDAPQSISHWIVGREFGFKLRMAFRDVPFNVTVDRFEPGRLIEWTSTKYSITAVRAISVVGEPGLESGTCRVTDNKRFSSPFLPIRLAYPRWLIRRMTESWLRDLKREAESGR